MTENKRIVSGMRTTGALHLGHLHGVIKNWQNLQNEYRCFFFAADLHALTTNYASPGNLQEIALQTVIDWLACGIDPNKATIFVQSHVPQHSELHLLLSMTTPVSWLERIPTYKEQQLKLKDKDLSTYGFLGYPLLQAADILLYKASYVPVGKDQESHVELCREIARRFNYTYGRDPDFAEKAEAAIDKIGKKNAKAYRHLRVKYQEEGDMDALETAHALIDAQGSLSRDDREIIMGYIEGTCRSILPEPEALLTVVEKMPGIDGQKMSKSYGNIISLREEDDDIASKVRTMPTDPARVRRSDPGNPEKCPVWEFHKIYSDEKICDWVKKGCTSAEIGCLDCKKPVIDAIINEITPIRERAKELNQDKSMIRSILDDGADEASEVAKDTLREVKAVMELFD